LFNVRDLRARGTGLRRNIFSGTPRISSPLGTVRALVQFLSLFSALNIFILQYFYYFYYFYPHSISILSLPVRIFYIIFDSNYTFIFFIFTHILSNLSTYPTSIPFQQLNNSIYNTISSLFHLFFLFLFFRSWSNFFFFFFFLESPLGSHSDPLPQSNSTCLSFRSPFIQPPFLHLPSLPQSPSILPTQPSPPKHFFTKKNYYLKIRILPECSMMAAPDGSAIFRPAVPNQAVATLLLIENSQEMLPIWPDLRDHHLPTLIGTMRIVNPVASVCPFSQLTSRSFHHSTTLDKDPHAH